MLCQAKDRLLLILIVNVAQDLQQASFGHLRTFSVSKHVLLTHICIYFFYCLSLLFHLVDDDRLLGEGMGNFILLRWMRSLVNRILPEFFDHLCEMLGAVWPFLTQIGLAHCLQVLWEKTIDLKPFKAIGLSQVVEQVACTFHFPGVVVLRNAKVVGLQLEKRVIGALGINPRRGCDRWNTAEPGLLLLLIWRDFLHFTLLCIIDLLFEALGNDVLHRAKSRSFLRTSTCLCFRCLNTSSLQPHQQAQITLNLMLRLPEGGEDIRSTELHNALLGLRLSIFYHVEVLICLLSSLEVFSLCHGSVRAEENFLAQAGLQVYLERTFTLRDRRRGMNRGQEV